MKLLVLGIIFLMILSGCILGGRFPYHEIGEKFCESEGMQHKTYGNAQYCLDNQDVGFEIKCTFDGEIKGEYFGDCFFLGDQQ